MNKACLILCAALLPSFAHANLTGNYTGSLIASDGRGLILPCELEMSVVQTSTTISIPKHSLHCGFMDKKWAGSWRLKIVNGRLIFSQGQVTGDIGSITSNELHANIKSCYGSLCAQDASITYDIVVNPDHSLTYEENWITTADSASHMKITGILNAQLIPRGKITRAQ